jgi:hypothetical protein
VDDRTRHDYVARPLVAGVAAQHASRNDAGGEGEGGIIVPGPPAGCDRAGRPRVLTWSAGRCYITLRYSAR